MTSSGTLLTLPGIPIGPHGNPFAVFQVGYWKIQLVLTESRAWAIESGWNWSGGTTTSKDTWTEIWGDGADAAAENDGAAIIKTINSNLYLTNMDKWIFLVSILPSSNWCLACDSKSFQYKFLNALDNC